MSTACGHKRAVRAVIGTTVKDASGARIGEIANLLLDKASRRILFAVVPCGSLGVAVPWASLRYDQAEDVYVATGAEEPETPDVGPIQELTDDGLTYQ